MSFEIQKPDERPVACSDGLGACVDFIQDQLVKTFADLKAREQMEQTWRGGTDEMWRAVGCTKTKAQRLKEADIDYSKPSHQIVIRNCHTGETHVLTLHISRQRIDQFKVLVDGELWKERIGMSRILAGVRKSLPRFSRFT